MKFSKTLFALLALFSIASCSPSASDDIDTNPEKNNGQEKIDTGDQDNKKGEEDEDIKYEYTYYDDSDSFTAGAVKLSFNSAGNYNYLKGIDGKKVCLKGFMFSASPVDGSFMFLSNMPYQSCPFCALNTSELSNCFEIYPKKNSKFTLLESAICVVGTLKVAPSKSELFNDKFGYEFLSKIEDGEIKVIDNVEEEGSFELRNAFANTNLLVDLYDMLNYVYFTCKWNEFFVNGYEDTDGTVYKGFYLYPEDALYFLTTDKAQWNYGYKDGYFDKFITDIKKIDETGFNDLIAIINECKETATYAISELNAGHYTREYGYVEKFDTNDYIYTLNDKSLASKPDELYNEFSYWLTSFEM